MESHFTKQVPKLNLSPQAMARSMLAASIPWATTPTAFASDNVEIQCLRSFIAQAFFHHYKAGFT
jgi:hypothetical protein